MRRKPRPENLRLSTRSVDADLVAGTIEHIVLWSDTPIQIVRGLGWLIAELRGEVEDG